MIRKIILENYMSHAKTVIEPAMGLTVLVGPNNCGKSAVVSALETLCRNLKGGYMVRHGEKRCKVTVETDDGHVLVWQRIKGTPSYVIDGKEIHRVGKSDPLSLLHEILRLDKVWSEDGTDSFDIHFADQKNPIFLLGDTGSRSAAFFASSSDADKLLLMQKKHKEKKTYLKRENRRLKSEINFLDEEIKSLADLEIIEPALEDVENLYSRILKSFDSIYKLNAGLGALQYKNKVNQYYSENFEILGELESPPELQSDKALDSLINNITGTENAVSFSNEESIILSTLEDAPHLFDTVTLKSVINTHLATREKASLYESFQSLLKNLLECPLIGDEKNLGNLCDNYESINCNLSFQKNMFSGYSQLSVPPEIFDSSDLESLCFRISKNIQRKIYLKKCKNTFDLMNDVPGISDPAAVRIVISSLEKTAEKLESANYKLSELDRLSDVPLLKDPLPLEDAVKKFTFSNSLIGKHEKSHTKIIDDIIKLEDEISLFISKNPSCPLCGGVIDMEHLIEGGAF
jgi:AAA ATPase-like protein